MLYYWKLLYHQHSISVITYENYGGKDASKVLNKLPSYSGSQISSRILLKLSFSSNPFDDIKFRRLLQKLKHFIIFNLGIKPFVKINGKKYKGVVNHWMENDISRKSF